MKLHDATKESLPVFFKPLLWSYDFSRIDLENDKKTIIVRAINYGDLSHWRWIVHYYGLHEVRKVLTVLPETEIRPRVRKLAELLFGGIEFSHAPRGSH